MERGNAPHLFEAGQEAQPLEGALSDLLSGTPPLGLLRGGQRPGGSHRAAHDAGWPPRLLQTQHWRHERGRLLVCRSSGHPQRHRYPIEQPVYTEVQSLWSSDEGCGVFADLSEGEGKLEEKLGKKLRGCFGVVAGFEVEQDGFRGYCVWESC